MQVTRELVGVVRELAAGHPLVAEVSGCTDDRLGESLPEGEFDEFYYAHDLTGSVCRKLAAAHPRARKVCTGDAFGMLYTAEHLQAYLKPASFRERLRARLHPSTTLAPLRPDIAAPVLPVDPSGRGLGKAGLVVCRKDAFAEAIRASHANAKPLREHMAGLLDRAGTRKRYLLLTENYADAGHVGASREIEMYAEIVRKYCEPGSAVIVKPHPLETPGKAEQIAGLLGGSYAVEAVDARFARYPVEIWLELVTACTVLCMAYPMLSLKYAHNIDVVNPMDEAFVERWIEPAHRKWTRDSLRLYAEPLARLQGWDGRSLLWAGPA